MVRTIEIQTIDEALSLLKQQEYDEATGRYRSPYYYRGMPDAKFRLQTTLDRNCKQKKKQLEKNLLRDFVRLAPGTGENAEMSVWNQLTLGQNYGLPTRLMDWTHSPLMALHFATSDENPETLESNDAVIWRIDCRELNAMLPQKYREALERTGRKVFTSDMLHSLAPDLDQYDEDMGKDALAVMEPPAMSERILNQNGSFLVMPSGMDNLEEFLENRTNQTIRYVVKAPVRWRIRDMLDQMVFNERIFYPGLDGIGKSLARHYYVRNQGEKE